MGGFGNIFGDTGYVFATSFGLIHEHAQATYRRCRPGIEHPSAKGATKNGSDSPLASQRADEACHVRPNSRGLVFGHCADIDAAHGLLVLKQAEQRAQTR